MPRPLSEIKAHIRAVAANPNVSTTLIQTEDLLALCDAAEPGANAIDLLLHRDKMVTAVLNRHLQSAIDCYPNARANMEVVQRENETYRPYAEADVDAIIAALDRIGT